MNLRQLKATARELGGAIVATVRTRQQDAIVRRVRRLAPYAVRVATPSSDPAWETRRGEFCRIAAASGGLIDAHCGHEVWAYFADHVQAACVRAAAVGCGLEVAAWDTRMNRARPYFPTYVDGYGPVDSSGPRDYRP